MAEGRGAFLERLLRIGVDTRPRLLGLPESATSGLSWVSAVQESMSAQTSAACIRRLPNRTAPARLTSVEQFDFCPENPSCKNARKRGFLKEMLSAVSWVAVALSGNVAFGGERTIPSKARLAAIAGPIKDVAVRSTQHVGVIVAWDERTQSGEVWSYADDSYEYCKSDVSVLSKNPNDSPAASSVAGYRFVAWKMSGPLVWQWWVIPSPDLFGPRHWLDADFSVTWILKTATKEQRTTQGCRPPPRIEERRGFGDNTGGLPPPATEYLAILRLYCKAAPGSIPTSGYIESRSASIKSCQAAREIVLQHVNSQPDMCAARDAQQSYSGVQTWQPTLHCP